MSKGYENVLKGSVNKMYNTNRDHVYNEVSRLGSLEQREVSYRRNGMLNFGAKQMFSLAGYLDFYTVGIGGPPVVS